MVHSMTPREGTLVADRYRLERKVGGGRVTATWRVQDEVTQGPCAIKLLHPSMHKHPEALTRFSLEDRLARELSGPHFPERVGSGSWDGMRYIAWRWHDGECLRTLFERNPKQDALTVHSIVQESCQALGIVHDAGYTHGDLKPENLFFADRGELDRSRQLKLIGFGVAARFARVASGALQTHRKPGHIVGTSLYMSPDLILGRTPKGGKADLWALAVIVYEALTGRAPFLGADLGEVLQSILDKQAPKPSSLADNLPDSFDLWWAQALEEEFSTPSEFATSLTRALAPALRTSHTQRSALLPERAPASVESLTPIVAPAASIAPLAGTVPGMPRATNIAPLASTVAGVGSAPRPVGSASTPVGSASTPVGSASTPVGSASTPVGSASTPVGVGSAPPPVAVGAAPVIIGSAPPPVAVRAAPVAVGPTAPRASGGGAKHAEPATPSVDPGAANKFAPLPSPLRDFASGGLRKTLVGIIPPASLAASSPSPVKPLPTEAIEGAPCKSIELAVVKDAAVESSFFGNDTLRRPSNPTVPFPRPRVQPREAVVAQDDFPLLGHAPGQGTWRGTTSRTLRVALTSPDRRPQRVAAVLVCALAALVIFVLGRSPVAGTGKIGQATGALAPESVQSPSGLPQRADGEASGSTASNSSASKLDDSRALDNAGSDNAGSDNADMGTASAQLAQPGDPGGEASPLPGEELAPGLVVPPSPARVPTRAAPAARKAPPARTNSPTRTSPAAPSGASQGASERAKLGRAASRPGTSPSSTTQSKKPAPVPAPQRKSGGDFDFGI